MKKIDVIQSILGERSSLSPCNQTATAFAPTNIALVKYWGKRNREINLPVTPSLSISLDKKGAKTSLSVNKEKLDKIILNQQIVPHDTAFAKRLIQFLDLFREKQKVNFDINIDANIPVAAGLASSACGFSALVQALNQLYGWELTDTELSIFARLGSGSACRSLWNGFVEWHVGLRDDGMDSYAEPLPKMWPDFCVGLLIMQTTEKKISSREAMERTVATSPLYSNWNAKVSQDLLLVKAAIQQHDFALLGETAESNAMNMHALMLSAWPPVSYALPETVTAMQKIWQLRADGLELYFTQDAGPNLKLLFLEKDLQLVQKHFPEVEMIKPFVK